MKKSIILVLIFICLATAISAQGFYFDVGIGFGPAWTIVDGDDFVKEMEAAIGGSLSEFGTEMSLKAGYGPFSSIPLFFTFEFGGFMHYISDSVGDNISFFSGILGLGVIYYPIPLIQLGCSLGYTIMINDTSVPNVYMHDSNGGFIWNISAAVDLGKRNHGCLLGVKYIRTHGDTLEVSNADINASMVSFFVKYAYRKKTRQ